MAKNHYTQKTRTTPSANKVLKAKVDQLAHPESLPTTNGTESPGETAPGVKGTPIPEPLVEPSKNFKWDEFLKKWGLILAVIVPLCIFIWFLASLKFGLTNTKEKVDYIGEEIKTTKSSVFEMEKNQIRIDGKIEHLSSEISDLKNKSSKK